MIATLHFLRNTLYTIHRVCSATLASLQSTGHPRTHNLVMRLSRCLQWICSYALWPVAFLMGADIADCPKVAELVGVKTFVNEYLAYSQLGHLIANRAVWQEHVANNGSYYYVGQDIVLNGTESTLVNGILSVRTVMSSSFHQSVFNLF